MSNDRVLHLNVIYMPSKINTKGKYAFPYFLNITAVSLFFTKEITIQHQTATIKKNIKIVNISSLKFNEANSGV